MNPLEILPLLEQFGKIGIPAHVLEFEGTRKKNDGELQMVRIKITDQGPESGNLRYSCTAFAENGKAATGNSNSSLPAVLATVHWHDLDS